MLQCSNKWLNIREPCLSGIGFTAAPFRPRPGDAHEACPCLPRHCRRLTLAPFAASAQEAESPYSWNVTAVSDYLFRGVSQTDEADPAGRLHLHLAGRPVCRCLGFGRGLRSGDPSTEIDYQIGYGVDVTPRVNFDVLLNRYTYLGASDLNYNELITTTTLDETYKLTVAYTNDQWNSGTDGWYYGVGGQWGLPQEFTLSANVAQQLREGLARTTPTGTSASAASSACSMSASATTAPTATGAKTRASWRTAACC